MKAAEGLEALEKIADSDGYERVNDKFGRKALTLKISEDEIIRLQGQIDSCLDGIKKPNDVVEKIREVKKLFNKHRPSGLYPRQWIDTRKGDGVDKSRIQDTKDGFTVMQFNVLAEGLSAGPKKEAFQPDKPETRFYGGFSAVPQPEVCMDYELRQWRLLEVILSGGQFPICNADETDKQQGFEKDLIDVVAMQELDRFYGFFEPVLKIFGYKGIFYPKKSAPGVSLGHYSDGCALFWKDDVFEMGNHNSWSYDAGRSQIGMTVTLRHRRTGRTMIFAVTHLKAKASNEAVRVEQASELMVMMQKAASTTASELKLKEADIPMIIMADFNAEPVGKGMTCIKSILSRDSKPHFTSTYKVDPPNEELYTTCKLRGTLFKSVIDYILYNRDDTRGIQCSHILLPPRIEDLDPEVLPGFRYPSDHVSICAKFSLEK